MEQQTQTFPEYIFINMDDALLNFMEPYKPGGRYDNYDRLFMKRVLHAMSSALIHYDNVELSLSQTMGYFGNPSLIYSDETYDPNKAIDNAYKLAGQLLTVLQTHRAYVRNVFPYVFYDLTHGLAAVFRYDPALGRRIH